MAKWKTAQGRILESEIEEYKDSDGDRAYRARVRYVYRVNGRTYAGSTPYRHSWATEGPRHKAERFVQEYPAGKLVEVYYNAAQPERSFLVNNANSWLILLVVLLVASLIILLLLTPLHILFLSFAAG
ncbi:MAG: DUF3592 domain-containing protein [Aggregatilineales bacterium]